MIVYFLQEITGINTILTVCVQTSWGGTQVWLCQGRAAAEFESRPIQIPIFQERVTYSNTKWPNFRTKLPDFHFPKFSEN